MSFVTIPDVMNMPVMINTKLIENITISDDIITLNFASGNMVQTTMPRQILTKVDAKPEVVQPTAEWAG
jgi:hypothetical protein